MSSRSPSPESFESKRRDTSLSSPRKDSPSSSERTHHSIIRGEGDSLSPQQQQHQPNTSSNSESYFKPRRHRKHSDSASHTRRYSRRSHSRSKSPVQTKQHHYSSSRRSLSRSKSPQEEISTRRDQSRRSHSRSRSQSPSHRRRLHGKKSRSRSPSKRLHHTSRRSRSHSRSKSPVRHKRDYSRRSHSRSRSPPAYGKKPRSQEYSRQHDWSSGNRRSYQEKKFYHKDGGGKYHRTSTPIAKVASSSSTPVTTKEQASLSVAPLPPLSNAELEKLTPEQKLERALLAAQAVTPKINVPQPSISTLSTTSATVPLLGNPPGVQKKKLLWNKKSLVVKKWEGVSLGEDGGDDEAKAKFRRLMGMNKGTPPTQSTSQAPSTSSTEDSSEMKEKHEKLRRDLEQQYEASRYMTHLARGSGLGFGFSSNASS